MKFACRTISSAKKIELNVSELCFNFQCYIEIVCQCPLQLELEYLCSLDNALATYLFDI